MSNRLDREELPSGDSIDLVYTIVDQDGTAIDPTADGLDVTWVAEHKSTEVQVVADAGWISNIANVVTVAIPKAQLVLTGFWTQNLVLSNTTVEITLTGDIRVEATL